MTPLFASLTATLLPILAQEPEAPRGYTISWGLILLCVILGMVVALRPAKRDDRVRKAED